MSNLSNPIFGNQKELLERQKEEYKNALINNVTDIKDQSTEVGKKLLLIGGVVVAGMLVTKLFGGGKSKKKDKKKHKKHKTATKTVYPPNYNEPPQGYNSFSHDREDELTLSSERAYPARYQQPQPEQPSMLKVILGSEVVSMLTQQLTAILVMYLTKRLDEYVNANKIHEIAETTPVDATEVEYIYPDNQDAS